MTLAPIRGAPPGAPNPDFPIGEPRSTPAQPAVGRTDNNQQQLVPPRQRGTPIKITADGHTLTFKLIPEIPAIRRASMTLQIVTDAAESSAAGLLGFLQMSANNARAFLCDLRSGRSRIGATGDEDGTMQIEFEMTRDGPVLLIHKIGRRHVLHRLIIDRRFDLKKMADDLLADLGA